MTVSQPIHSGIIGIGHFVPDRVVTNHDFLSLGLDTSDEWIRERTGISERRIADSDVMTSDLATEAARMAIEDAGVDPDEIGMLILATSTPDYQGFPSTACVVQDRLGLSHAAAIDVSAACTGFVYGLSLAQGMIVSGQARYILVIGAECINRVVNWADRSTCVLFGDGAGAAVLGSVAEGYGLIGSQLFSDGAYESILTLRHMQGGKRFDGTVLDGEHPFIHMDGKSVFKVAIAKIVPAVQALLADHDYVSADLDYLILHQANLRIIQAIREKLQLSDGVVPESVSHYGNTSAASIPLMLADLKAEGKLKDGQLMALVGFGSGFTWGGNLLRWGGV